MEEGAVTTARRLYRALAARDPAGLIAVLHADFRGRVSEGMPFDLGGDHRGRDAMLAVWGTVLRHYDLVPTAEEFAPLADGRVLVTGRYLGTARATGRRVDAAFAHLLDIGDGVLTGLRQFTDTHTWRAALAEPA